MTTEAGLPDGLHDLPAWVPGATELADLELLLSGAYAPLTGFLGSIDCAVVAAAGRLADGTPWPVEVTLTVPPELAKEPRIVLHDPEGTPLATLTVTESWETPGGDHRLAGPVQPLRAPAHGPFRRLRRTPAEVKAELAVMAPPAQSPVLAVATREPLHRKQLGQLRQVAEKLASARHGGGGAEGPRVSAEQNVRLLVLPLISGEHEDALVRALLAVRQELPPHHLVVPVPLARHEDAERDLRLRAHLAAAYGATHLLMPSDLPFTGEPEPLHQENGGEGGAEGTVIPVVAPEPWAYDVDVEVWRPVARIDPDHQRVEYGREWLDGLLDRGEPIPEWFTPPAVATELAAARPPRHRRGLTVFFTGLSGSGKSTVARGLADAVIERGGRTVSLLDGDVVRRLLSAGLTFSKSDRDLNIRRIGYVAAEVTRHGGMAVCAPIAPYAATRAEVRRMVSAVGDFVLVHVATPLEECERRDRKGLYAKARAGLIPEFTGISDPYEEPEDADLVLDTSQLSQEEAVDRVLDLLAAGGWIRPA